MVTTFWNFWSSVLFNFVLVLAFGLFSIWASLVGLVWTKRTSGVLNFKPGTFYWLLFVCFSVLYVLPFICIVFLSCNFIILMLYLTLPWKREVWHAIKPGLTHHFFLKCPLPSPENGHCYIIVRFCMCYILMLFLLCRSYPLKFDAFPSVLVCNSDFFFFTIDVWISNSGILHLQIKITQASFCVTVIMIIITQRKHFNYSLSFEYFSILNFILCFLFFFYFESIFSYVFFYTVYKDL